MSQSNAAAPAAPDAMSRFRRWAAIAVAVAALGWLGYAVFRGFTETASELAAFQWGWYVPVLLLTLVNYGLRYLKWHYLLGRLGIDIPHSANLWVFTAGLAMVISPAKAGEVVKPYLVRVMSGAPMARTIPALVAERTTDGIAVVGLAAVGVTTYYAEAAELIYGVIAAFAIGLALLAYEPLARRAFDLAARLPLVGGLASRLWASYDAMRICLAPVPFAVTLGLSLVAWFAECVGYWIVFYALSVQADLGLCTFLYAFSTVFGAPSPGGMGMADLALAEGALQLVPALTAGQAVAASLLVRVATLWFGVGLGAIALLRMETVIARMRAA